MEEGKARTMKHSISTAYEVKRNIQQFLCLTVSTPDVLDWWRLCPRQTCWTGGVRKLTRIVNFQTLPELFYQPQVRRRSAFSHLRV